MITRTRAEPRSGEHERSGTPAAMAAKADARKRGTRCHEGHRRHTRDDSAQRM